MFTFLPGPFLVQFSGPFYLSTDNTRDLLEIRYWLLSSNLGQNDNFLMARFNIEKQKELVEEKNLEITDRKSVV